MDHIDKDEELVCPLCGGQVLWMPVSHIYVCEHCKQSYSEMNGVYLQKKRKATAEKSSAVGDAAATREALQAFVRAYEEPIELDNIEATALAYDQAKAALAKPARNCERFATADDAKREFNYLWNFVWKRGGGCLAERNYVEEFERWLFAPATEKEGGAK